MLKHFLALSPLLGMLLLAACSSGDTTTEDSVTQDELNDDGDDLCGGIAGILCPKGKRCEMDGDFGDASGTCVVALPGELGSICSTSGVQCKAGLECQLDDLPEEETGGPPPGAMGMPAIDGGSGPPPGAVGMPMQPEVRGTCVRKSSGPPPGAMGMPIQ